MNPKVHNKFHNTAPKGSVYIGRGSQFGNPFKIGKDGTRDDVCNKFDFFISSDESFRQTVKENLKGKDLVCFCKPARCHGDSLLKIANED